MDPVVARVKWLATIATLLYPLADFFLNYTLLYFLFEWNNIITRVRAYDLLFFVGTFLFNIYAAIKSSTVLMS